MHFNTSKGISALFGGFIALLWMSVSWAAPNESTLDTFRKLALNEKLILEQAITEYEAKISELNEELVRMKVQQEWAMVKIETIRESKRVVPSVLQKNQKKLVPKIQSATLEKKRLKMLVAKYLDRLASLDEEVRQTFPTDESLDWWTIKPSIAALITTKNQGQGSPEGPLGKSIPGSTLAKDLEDKINDSGLSNWVKLEQGPHGLKLVNQLPILFGSGKTSLAKDYKKMFKKLVHLLKPYATSVALEGFTDSSRVKGKSYLSNWELGASRAASVARYMISQGMKPEIFKVISRGEYGHKPMAEGTSKTMSKAMSRRVDLTVLLQQG